jgi:hypothetical protein
MNAIDAMTRRQHVAEVFGTSNNLVGVTRLPSPRRRPTSGGESPTNDVCVVMLNAGILHHVGPYRLHVDMAESLARQGVSSFRFDLSGIGESLPSGSTFDSTSRAVVEARQAIDLMQDRYGFERFILFGLCSGADDAINVALADRRVKGVVMLDGCGFRTSGYHVHRFFKRQLPSLFRTKKLTRKFRGLLGRPDHERPSSLAPGSDIREFPDRRTTQTQIQSLIDRGTSMMMFYTGGVHDYFNHGSQFEQMFPGLKTFGRLSVHYRAHWDHVLYLPEDREQLIDEVTHWTTNTFTPRE